MSDYKQAQAKAASIVKSELAVAGINTEGLVLENGSGLSRVERLNARMMAQMLEKPTSARLKTSLSVRCRLPVKTVR